MDEDVSVDVGVDDGGARDGREDDEGGIPRETRAVGAVT